MIPGPVAGRTPVDPGAAQRQLTEPVTESAESGSSFADLLAAMLSPGAMNAQLQASVPAAQEAVFERLDAAEIFNETGLFRGAAPLPAAVEQGVTAAEPAPPPGPVTAGPDPQTDLRTAMSSASAASQAPDSPAWAAAGQAESDAAPAPASATAAAGGGSRTAARAGATLHGQPAAVPAGSPQSGEVVPEAVAGGRSPARTAAMLVQAYLAKSGSLPAQLSIQAVEGGISLVARADKLTREERDRLRLEIGELLARHGFAVAGMILNGEAWPLPQGRDD